MKCSREVEQKEEVSFTVFVCTDAADRQKKKSLDTETEMVSAIESNLEFAFTLKTLAITKWGSSSRAFCRCGVGLTLYVNIATNASCRQATASGSVVVYVRPSGQRNLWAIASELLGVA